MTKTEMIKNQFKLLNLTSLPERIDQVILEAQSNQISYLELIILKTG